MKRVSIGLFAASLVLFLVSLANLSTSWSGVKEKEIYFAGVDGVTEPVRTKIKKPRYPNVKLEEAIEGYVILQAVIGTGGTINEVTLLTVNIEIRDEMELAFKNAAIKAVKKWRYEPAELDGDPVDAYWTIIVRFNEE